MAIIRDIDIKYTFSGSYTNITWETGDEIDINNNATSAASLAGVLIVRGRCSLEEQRLQNT